MGPTHVKHPPSAEPFLIPWAVLGIVLAAALLYAALAPHFQTGIFNDDAVYVLVANDLSNRVTSKLLISIKPDYPLPGLPMFLAPWTMLVNSHWTNMEWVSVMVGLATIILYWFWARRWLPPGAALVAILLYAFNPTLVKYSGVVMPAVYYTFMVLASFCLLSRVVDRPRPLECLLLGALTGWGSVLRAEGIVLLASVLLAVCFSAHRKRILSFMSIPLLGWVLCLYWWMHFRGVQQSDYAGDIMALRNFWTAHFSSGIDFAWSFFELLFAKVLLQVQDLALWHSDYRIALALAGILGVATGCAFLWKEKKSQRLVLLAAMFFCVTYTLIHIFWHIALPRYGIPLLPFILIGLGAGGQWWLKTLSIKRWPMLLVSSALFLWYGRLHVASLQETYFRQNPFNAPPWQTLDWIRQKTPAKARIMSPISASIALYTRRKAVPILKLSDAESFRYGLEHETVSYILDRYKVFVTPGVANTDNLNLDWQRARRWLAIYPNYFSLEYENTYEQARVYRVRQDVSIRPEFERFLSAVEEVRHERYAAARKILLKEPTTAFQLGHASNLLGVIEFQLSNDAKAEQRFLESSKVWIDSPIPLLNLATLMQQRGDRIRSVKYLNQALGVINQNDEATKLMSSMEKLINAWGAGIFKMIY